MKYKLERFYNLEFIISSSYNIESLLELESFKSFFLRLNDLLGVNLAFKFYVF